MVARGVVAAAAWHLGPSAGDGNCPGSTAQANTMEFLQRALATCVMTSSRVDCGSGGAATDARVARPRMRISPSRTRVARVRMYVMSSVILKIILVGPTCSHRSLRSSSTHLEGSIEIAGLPTALA